MAKEIFSAAGIALTFILYYPYIRSIQRSETKPHVFSWVIWGLSTLIVFFAQLAGRGGFGAWVIGVSGLISCYLAFLSYWKRGDTVITRADWVFLFAAFFALPFWFLTSDPVWAVVILTFSDLAGFGPTIRKAYSHPYDESVSLFALFTIRNGLVILALEHYSLTTVLFPAAVGLACLIVVILLVYWRHLADRGKLHAAAVPHNTGTT